MGSQRPYSGMSWDDLEHKLNQATKEFLEEVSQISEELKHRSVPSIRPLKQRVARVQEFFIDGTS